MCAKRASQGDLALPCRGEREQQVRDIGACDQENEPHCGQKHDESAAHLPRVGFLQRLSNESIYKFHDVRVLPNKALGQDLQFRVGLFQAESGLQPGDSVLVQGAGGGVATSLIMLARAAGFRVYATSRDEDKRKAIEAGFDDHLVKPLTVETFQKLLGRLEARRGLSGPAV